MKIALIPPLNYRQWSNMNNMKYLLLILMFGVYSLIATEVFAATVLSRPHIDYRPGYSTGAGCGGTGSVSTACHTINKVTFLPSNLNTDPAPSENDFTNFCLACHNAAGEAHEKSPGSPSTNRYTNLTGFYPGQYSGDSHSWNGLNGNAGHAYPDVNRFSEGRRRGRYGLYAGVEGPLPDLSRGYGQA